MHLGGGLFRHPTLRNFVLADLILDLRYCALRIFFKKEGFTLNADIFFAW